MTAGPSFRVLGSLEYYRDGNFVEISAPKLRIVLASLVLRPGQPVPFDTLVERLWDTAPPADARAALQSTLARLRRLLGPDTRIRAQGRGYALELRAGCSDLEEFEALMTAAQAAVGAGDRIAGVEALRRATALWRGPVLFDVQSAALHRDEVPSLVERCLQAAEQRFEVELVIGNHRGIVEELRHLATAHPLREGLRAHLMWALYRCGRQAEALDVYQETRVLLQSELGVEPGPNLRAVQQAVLLGQDEFDWSSPITSASTLCQLPPTTSDFVGRADDVRTVEKWLSHGSSVPVSVISGVPGVGKSTLATHVAHRRRQRFPDGQLYVNLEGAGPTPRDPADVLGELLEALGHEPSTLPQGLSARAAAFRARVADHKYLVLLDDAESAEQVLPLIPGTPGSAVLVTSRRFLPELGSTQELRLKPFSTREGVVLLRHSVDDLRITQEPDVAEELVDLCGRLPLALRIVGARLRLQRSMPLSAIAERLRDDRRRLDELSVGRLDLRTGLDFSYAALPEPVQVAFRRMALLPSGFFAAWALGAICDGTDGERLAEQLTTAGLLEAVGTDRSGRSRFRPHDLVAVYARELSNDESEDVQRPGVERLLDTLLSLGFEAYPKMTRVNESLPPDEMPVYGGGSHLALAIEDADSWIDGERTLLLHTIELACRFGLYNKAAILADVVVPALAISGSFDQLQRTRGLVRDAALASGDERVAARSETGRGDLLLSERIDSAAKAFEFCLPIFRRLGQPHELVHSLTGLAFARSWQGLHGAAHAEEAASIATEADDPNMLVLALRSHGEALLLADEPARALALFHEAMSVAQGLDRAEALRIILVRITACATTLGDLEAAEMAYQQAYDLTDTTTNALGLAWLLMHHSRIRRARGNYDAATTEAQRAYHLMKRAGDVRGMVTVSTHLAESVLEVGDVTRALRILDDTLAALEANDVPLLRERAQALRAKALALDTSFRCTTKSVVGVVTRP